MFDLMKNSLLSAVAVVTLAAGLAVAPHSFAAMPVNFGGVTFIPFGQTEVSVTNLLAGGSLPGGVSHEAVAITRLNVGSSNGVVIRMPGVSEFGADMTPLALPPGSMFRLRLRGTNGLELGAVTFTGPSGTANPTMTFSSDFSGIGATSRTVELRCRNCATPACPVTVPGASGGSVAVAAISNVPVQIVGFRAQMTRGAGSTAIGIGIVFRDESEMSIPDRGPIREDHDEGLISVVVPGDLPSLGQVELTAVAIGTPRILFPCFRVGNGFLAQAPSSLFPGGLRLSWEGTGLLESSTNIAGPWSPLSTPLGTFETSVAAPRLFLRVLEQLPACCRHDLSLNNTASPGLFRRVRVVTGNAGTRIVMAIPTAGWTQTLATPTNVTWTPTAGAVPIGAPLPGSLAIWVQQNPAPDKHVFLEWLDVMTNVLCRQKLAVPCSAWQDPYQPDDVPGSPGTSPVPCDCVSSVVTADPDSLERAEPDFEAEIGPPVQLSRTRFKFTNLSVVEPANIQMHCVWTVTRRNHLQEDEILPVPVTFDGSGNPTYDFPGPGVYTVFLRCQGTNCLGNDFDFASRKVAVTQLEANFNWAQQLCDPLRLDFTDASVSDNTINSWEWRIYSFANNTPLATYTSQNMSHLFAQYPAPGQPYRVELIITAGGQTATNSRSVFFDNACHAEFDWYYFACGNTLPVRVQFLNKSSGLCPTPVWNFGDGGTSTLLGPAHDYAAWGQYSVRLTMTDMNGQDCTVTHTLTLQPNSVKLDREICPDGKVYFETDAPNPVWSFPLGSPTSSTSASQLVRYGAIGTYQAVLTSSNANHAVCIQTNTFQITNIVCCARNDRTRTNFEFSAGGKDYRMTCKFVQVNALGLHYLHGKTKLKKKSPSGIYKAARADSVSVQWGGDVFRSSDHCDCVTPWHEDAQHARANKTKAIEIEYVGGGFPGASFRTHTNSLTSTHKVTVGGITQTLTLTLGHDCD